MAKRQDCYCSFCKNKRSVYTKKHIGLFDIAFCLLAATLLTFIFWQKLDPRLSVIAVGMCILAEMIVHIRWRVQIACSFCGFDPVLYLKSPDKASQKVSLYMDKRKSTSSYLLAAKQYDKLTRLSRKVDLKASPNKEKEMPFS